MKVAAITNVNVSAPGQPQRFQDVEIRTIYDLLDLLRLRPGMWIGVPSVVRLHAFIDGFRTGIEAAHHSLDAESPPFETFHDWVAAHHGGRPSSVRGWPALLLEAADGDEAGAFEMFWTELDAFRASVAT